MEPTAEFPAYFCTLDYFDGTVVASSEVYNDCQIVLEKDPDGNVVGIEIVSGTAELAEPEGGG